MLEAQKILHEDPFNERLKNEEREAASKYAVLNKAAESFLQQKSKADWIALGDQNTAYFHAVMKQKFKKSRVTAIVDQNGTVVDDPDQVEAHFLDFFRKLLGQKREDRKVSESRIYAAGMVLNVEQQLRLIEPVTDNEIQDAMFSINSIKSPGPNGYGSGFFQGKLGNSGD